MSTALTLPPSGFDDLTVDEKLDYVQALWDRITGTEPEIPVPGWHREVLEERLAEDRADPEEGQDWKEFSEDLLLEIRGTPRRS
jgi:Putative addiction module component